MEMEKAMVMAAARTTAWVKVPKKVLDLLAGSRWQDDAKVFESNFEDRGDRKRWPSWYHFPRGETEPSWGSAFSGAETWALHEQGAFGPHAATYARAYGDVVSVNEHAAHALCACLAEMAQAWDKYQARLAEIPVALTEEDA